MVSTKEARNCRNCAGLSRTSMGDETQRGSLRADGSLQLPVQTYRKARLIDINTFGDNGHMASGQANGWVITPSEVNPAIPQGSCQCDHRVSSRDFCSRYRNIAFSGWLLHPHRSFEAEQYSSGRSGRWLQQAQQRHHGPNRQAHIHRYPLASLRRHC